MSTEKTVTVKAEDGTMTIADLRAFLEEFDKAADSHADYDAKVLKPKARVSFRGGIKSITVTVPG